MHINPKTKNKNLYSKDNLSISEIERIIDEMFIKKQETAKPSSKEIDFKEISLKSKNGKHLYYLKKRTNKKNTNKEKLSKKIIKEAKTKLDKIDDKKLETGGSSQKNKKRVTKKSDKQERENYKKVSHKIDEILEKDELIEVIKKPTKPHKTHNKKIPSVKKQILYPIKIPRIKIKLNKKPKNRTTQKHTKDKKTHDKKLETKPDIVEKIKKEKPQEIDKSVFFSETKKEEITTNEENKIIEEKIEKYPHPTPTEQKIEETEKPKKPFFKDKKEGKEKKKKTLFTKEEEKTKQEKPSIDQPKSSPFKFKVENIPTQEPVSEEIELVDKQIKETPEKAIPNEKIDEFEIKADKFIKKHIVEKPINVDQVPFFKDKKPSEENLSEILSPAEDKTEYEHVFFDEHVDFEGWTPIISEKERKQMSLPLQPKPELRPSTIEIVKDVELPKEVLSKSVSLKDLGFSENEWEELDFYPLVEPFAYVEILREKDSFEKRYFLVEVEVTDEEKEILDFITDTIKNYSFDTEEYELKNEGEYLLTVFEDILKEYNINLTEESKGKILYFLGRNSIGFGKLDPVMHDPNIEDISCDGAGIPIFLYHRKYGSLKSNIVFKDEEELSSFIHRLAQKCGKHISIAEPMLDATMPDGSRIQMTLSDEVTTRGSTFTIRKFKDDPFSPPDLLEYNTMSSEMIAYLWLAIENKVNALFAGGTASGKTTALNAIALFIPPDSKIVTIEETRELNLPHKNWIPGVARTGFGPVISDKMQGEIDMYDLMKAALRQRPEYILVGEIRGREAYVLFQAMATGHATYSTVHADSAQSLIHRLEGKPINIPRVMLQSLDIISLHVTTRVRNKRVRRCKQIIEIIDIDPTTKEILTNEVFRWDPVEDKFIYSGKSYVLEKIRAEKDLSREEMTQEIQRRQRIIEWMNKNNIREFREVANIVARYNESPSEVMQQIEKGKETNE